MEPVLVLVQLFHVLAGVVWLGGSIFMNLVVLPAVLALPIAEQRKVLRRVILGPERLMVGAALAAAILGVVRGVVFGPIRSLEALSTPYGLVWMAAIAATVGVFALGALVTSPAARQLLGDSAIWEDASRQDVDSALHRQIQRVRRGFRLELAGILAIFALMPVLRFL